MSPSSLRNLRPGTTVYRDGAPVTLLSSDPTGRTARVRDALGDEHDLQHTALHLRGAPPFAGAEKVAAVYVERWRDGTYAVTVVRKPDDGVGQPVQIWKVTGVSRALLPDALDSASTVVERQAGPEVAA